MNFTLHQLRVFLKIVEKESITQAARELHLTQPAVSIQMKKFQEQFEVPLVEVIGRQLYITDLGREVAVMCGNIMMQVDEIKYKTMAYKGQLVGKLKIAVVSTAKYVMPYFLAGFLADNPGVDLIMDVTNKARVVESLSNNTVDFAMVSVLPDQLMVERTELMENQLFLVGKAPDKGNATTLLPSLAEMPLIYREEGSATRQAMERFMQGHDIAGRKTMELTSNEAVKQAVLAGLGYSVMPRIGIQEELRTGRLQIIPLPGLPLITWWNLVWPKGKSFSPIAKAFLAHIQTHKAKIIQENFPDNLTSAK